MDALTLLTYSLACVAIVIVPGPTVTVIIANALRNGSKAGLMNVAGTQAGLFLILMALAVGFQVVLEHLAIAFDWIRLIGAAYLIWLGIKMLRSKGNLQIGQAETQKSLWHFFWQGFFIILSNPKVLLFFGSFIPQFLDPSRKAMPQVLILGAIFMVVASLLDGAYALLAGQAGSWLTRSRVRILEVASGLCLIGGGLWLALLKR